MDQGPLPPHERSWRHPSEIAADERSRARAAAAAPSTRLFALVTGTVGLIAVGALILIVTPRRQESPIAISATTTPITVDAGKAPTQLASGTATFSGGRDQTTFAVRRPTDLLATPIGDGRLALVTTAALTADIGDRVEVTFVSGGAGSGMLVASGDEAALVELDDPEPGHALAQKRPSDHETVRVMADPPLTVLMEDIGELDVVEGTPVLDHDGALVGLCSKVGDGPLHLVEVNSELADATTADR